MGGFGGMLCFAASYCLLIDYFELKPLKTAYTIGYLGILKTKRINLR